MARARASAVLPSVVALLVAGLFASAQGQGQGQGPQRGNADSLRPVVSSTVRSRLAREGHTRVIVELRMAGMHVPEPVVGRAGGQAAVQARRQNLNAVRARALSRIPAVARRELRRYETLPLVALEIDPSVLSVLEASSDVLRVVPDEVLRASLAESVPRIEGDQAWQAGFDGTGTAVAILDSGVDATHPFLAGKVVREACFSGSIDGLSASFCPNGQTTQIGAGAAAPCNLDNCFHGTHVAGIAAGNGDAAGEPFSGVAKGANLVAVQVFSAITDAAACGGAAPCLGAFESDIIAALEYVYGLRTDGFNVASVNLSLGGGSFDAPCDSDPMKLPIDNLRAIGVPSVVAAGNNAEVTNLALPACISSAVSVGATDIFDEVAWFSNVAPFLSLFAPGDPIVSSIPGGDYDALSGTSMAAPHVAGAWAIFRQAVPAASVDEVLNALRTTGVPITDTREGAPGTTTLPRIRIVKALSTLTTLTSPVPTLTDVLPSTGRAGLPLTLTLLGTGFNAASVVRWNGVDVPTVADSITQISAKVPANLVVLGTFAISVFNPAPGGGVSESLPITVLPPPSLTVDQTAIGPSQDVTVTLTNGFGGDGDWLAVAPAGSADGTYIRTVYVGAGVTSRTWTIKSPVTSGQYEFRLFVDDTFARVATSAAFTVDASISPAPDLSSLDTTSAMAGSAPITLTVFGNRFMPFSIVTWNGSPRPTTFVSSEQLRVAISAADLAAPGTAAVSVTTPAPGGGTSTGLTFRVFPAPALTVNTVSAIAGTNITVTLADGLGGGQDWLAFAPTAAADVDYVQFTYVGAGVSTRTWTVTAPATPGTYEFRLYRQGSFVRLATSPTVIVTAAPSPELSISATAVAGGQPVTATLLNGQGGSQDWLAFAPTGAGDSAYLQFVYVGAGVTTRTWTVNTPTTSGAYEFRLYKQNSFVRLATSAAVTVTGPPPPSPTISVNVTTTAPGGPVTATLANGPGGANDLLVLAATGAADSNYVLSVSVGAGVTSRAWAVTMPAAPGGYEFRLLVNGVKAAVSPTVSVAAAAVPQLAVSATTVTVGAPITVTLTNGLGGNQDWIAFAATTAANNTYVQFVYVGAGVTTRTWTINAPATAGSYEFRLFQNGTFTRLATSATIVVQAAPPPTLTVSTTSAAHGTQVTVTLTNGLGGSTDWLAFAAVGAPDSAYLNWTYVGGNVTTRTWTVTLPATPGNYEFRLYRQGSFVRIATSLPIAGTSPNPW
jgi:subtilisin